MSIVASVVDGKIVNTTASANSVSKSTSSSGSTLDKDAFLQLLVAQMKYQDPLEPTSNTEYISQFATFSELEEMQNLSSNSDLSRASELVGKDVIMKVTSETTGNTDYVSGKVDYVVIENGEAYLSIESSLYALSDLDTVIDSDYLKAYNLVADITTALGKLPTLANVTLSDKTAVEALQASYDGLTEYQKTLVSSTTLASIKSYTAKIKELTAANTTTVTTDTDDTEA